MMRSILTALAATSIVAAVPRQSPPAPALQVSLEHRALRPGELVALTIRTPQPAASVHVRAFDRDWLAHPADASTWRAFIGIDLDTAPAEYPIAIRADAAAGTWRHTERVGVTARTFPTRRLSVDDAFVNPPASVQARIASEAAELNKLWRSSTGPPLWTGPFGAPVTESANSAFGTRSIFNGEPRSAHSGADFASQAGTPVLAPAAGRVVLARDLYYSGGTIVVDHGAGILSLFAHLSERLSRPGALVAKGDAIGKVGATGRVTGAHLHWAVRVNGARVDPLAVLAVLGPSESRR
jgi:murein DD-endopeptidase MepM/ murein hydrolase activator NlpD